MIVPPTIRRHQASWSGRVANGNTRSSKADIAPSGSATTKQAVARRPSHDDVHAHDMRTSEINAAATASIDTTGAHPSHQRIFSSPAVSHAKSGV